STPEGNNPKCRRQLAGRNARPPASLMRPLGQGGFRPPEQTPPFVSGRHPKTGAGVIATRSLCYVNFMAGLRCETEVARSDAAWDLPGQEVARRRSDEP